MKTLEEIKGTNGLRILNTGIDGGVGELWRAGKPFATVIWSNGGGWEHVSICPYKRSYTPTWDEMCSLKDMFFHDNEVVVQFHPAKSEYINNMPNCLHLWRPLNEVMPTPPSIMVGVKKGQSLTEIREEIKAIANNEKQIEEMVKDISGVSEFAILGLNNAFIKVRVACETIAERLYNAGYRKQSEVLIIPEMSDEDIERAIDIIKKNRPQIIADDKSEAWISVDERLPESGEHCLISCTVKRFDGTHGQYVCVGYYAEKFKHLAYGVDDDCISEYNEENDEFYISEGWYEVIKNWDDYGFVAIGDFVTHWMPLPEAPKMKGGAE